MDKRMPTRNRKIKPQRHLQTLLTLVQKDQSQRVYKLVHRSGMFRSQEVEAIVKELGELEKEHGFLTNEIVLERAKMHGSTLHDLIEWNDKEAAHKYRKTQASLIMNGIVLQEIGSSVQVPYFYKVALPDPANRGEITSGTVSIGNMEHHPDMLAEYLDRGRERLKRFRDRYAGIKEFAPVLEQINKVLITKKQIEK